MPIDPSKLNALVKQQSAASPVPMMQKKAAAQAASAQTPKSAGTQRMAGFAGAKPGMKKAPKKAAVSPAAPAEGEVDLSALVEQAAQAAESESDADLEMLLPDLYKSEPGQLPSWVGDAELWKQAHDAVGVGALDEDRYEEPMAVVAYLYKMMGGPVAGDGAGEEQQAAPGEEASDVSAKEVRGAAGKLAAAKAKAAGAKPMAKEPPGPEESPEHEAAESPEHEAAESVSEEMVEESARNALTEPDPELVELLAGYDPERDGNPPQWALDEAKWEKAVKAVEPKWEDYEAPYAVVAHVYKNMGGKVKKE